MSTNLKRFLIHCSTAWCGMDDTYRAVAEKEEDLWEIADQLAYENFMSYGGPDLILEEYDTEDLSEEEIEAILEMKEDLDILEWALHQVEFIRDLVYEASCDWNEYNKILCNVD